MGRDLSAEQSSNFTLTKVIKEGYGEACIPLEPKRIVALDVPAIVDSLVAIDIKPVGTVVDFLGNGEHWNGKRYFPALLPELVAGIESVGAEATPSLEKILQLKPDLILLANQSELAYQQLSKIAPVVLIDTWKDRIPIKENFQQIARIMGKEKEGEKVLARSQERISKFKNQLGDRLLGLEISVLSYYENQLFAPASWASYFQIFQDLGLPIKPIFLKQEDSSASSIELISGFDADILFFVEVNNPSPHLYQNPLIQSLKAVKNGRAYIVDGRVWEFYGPIGMNLFLDALSKYLLKGKQDPYLHKRTLRNQVFPYYGQQSSTG